MMQETIKTTVVLIILLLIAGGLGFRLTTFVIGIFKHKKLSCHGSEGDISCPHCDGEAE